MTGLINARTGNGIWVAGATMGLATVLDLIYGAEASLIVCLVFGPFVASALASVRATVAIAATAVLAGVLLGWPNGTAGTSAHLVRVAAVSLGGCLAVWLAVKRTRREAKLRAVSHVADVVQRAILPPLPAEIRGVRLAARYLSASVDARIGGDFYEALDSPWGLRIMVGDVRGKGLDAVRLVAILLGEFRSRAASEPELGAVAKMVDQAGARLAEEFDEDFATAVFVQIDGPVATVVRSGHPMPLVAEGSDVRPIVTSSSLPLCLGTEGIAEPVRLPMDARLLCYSDGADEGRDAGGKYFDLASSFARHSRTPNPGAVLDKILSDLERHCEGEIGDDVVLVIADQPADRNTNRRKRPGPMKVRVAEHHR